MNIRFNCTMNGNGERVYIFLVWDRENKKFNLENCEYEITCEPIISKRRIGKIEDGFLHFEIPYFIGKYTGGISGEEKEFTKVKIPKDYLKKIKDWYDF